MAANASLILTCTQSSQDIANNKSTVSIKVVCQLKNGVSFSNAGIKTTVSVTCDGQTKSFAAPTSYDVGANGSLTLGSVSFTVSHASDGVKSINYSASWTPPYLYGGGTATGSGSKTLTTIPRASTISSVSGSTLGSAVTVNISRKASSFTHIVTYKFGSITRSYSGQTTACTFTPPLSDASAIPNASSGTATVTVQTMSGSTKIGSAISKTFTLNLPASAVPSISGPSITRVDNGVPSAWGIYVKGFSKANVSISGSGIYGSSISSYSISGGGYSSTTSSLSSGVLNTAGTITFTGTVKDSRNRTKSANVSVTVYDYQVPTVSLNAERCNSDGSINPDGVYVKVTASFSVSSVNGKNNVASKKIEVVGTSYSKSEFISGNSEVLGGAISIDKTYIVKATVTDTLGKTSTSQVSIPTGEVVLDFKSNGKGVAFGKVAETDRLLDSAWDVKASGFKGEKSGVVNTISSDNASYTHYRTTAPGHWFDKKVQVQGEIYGGNNYNRRLAYIDECLINRGDIPAQANLNNYTTSGYYHQLTNANAQSGSNYPISEAGLLTVYNCGYIYQTYYHYFSSGVWYRTYYNGSWRPWIPLYSDTGWIALGLSNGVSAATLGGRKIPSYRKMGNQIIIEGGVSLTGLTSSGLKVASLPYRPAINHYVLNACSGTRIARVYINASGELRVEWIYNISGSQFTGNISWVEISMSFFID